MANTTSTLQCFAFPVPHLVTRAPAAQICPPTRPTAAAQSCWVVRMTRLCGTQLTDTSAGAGSRPTGRGKHSAHSDNSQLLLAYILRNCQGRMSTCLQPEWRACKDVHPMHQVTGKQHGLPSPLHTTQHRHKKHNRIDNANHPLTPSP